MPRYMFYIVVITATVAAGVLLYPLFGPQKPSTLFKASGEVQYSLTSTEGGTVTEKTFNDIHTLVFFGYTYCPDVCPTTLQDVSTVMDLLGDDAQKIKPVFITFDPERDTVEHLKAYLEDFHPAMIGLTGEKEQTIAAAKSFRVFYKKEKPDEDDPESYLVSHTAFVYLIGPNGKGPLKQFKYGEKPETIAAAVQDIL